MNLPNPLHFKNFWNWIPALLSETLGWPILSFYARWCVSAKPSPPNTWRKLLLLGADHIGDVLYRTSSLRALHEALPGCQIDWLVSPPAHEVLIGNPFINKLIVCKSDESRASLLTRMRAEGYDAAICYDVRSHISRLLLLLQAGIPNRMAYVHKGFSAWVNYPVVFRPYQPYPGYFRDLVADLAKRPADWSLRPVVPILPSDEAEARAFRNQFRLEHKVVLACFPTSRQPSSSFWAPENFVCVLKSLTRHMEYKLVLCGAPSDKMLLEEMARELHPRPVVCAGELSLRALVAFIKTCRAVFSADSKPRHLSNAAGVPVVFVRNTLFHPVEAGVYCEGEYDCWQPSREQQVELAITKLTTLLRLEAN